jgi:lysophospholipase L1-like esterase
MKPNQKLIRCCLLAVLLSPSMLNMSRAADFDKSNIQRRSNFQNARVRFEKELKGHVAFMGGSITAMNGYRPMVVGDLKKRFPKTQFTFTDAGISSTCSTTGAMRLHADVLSKGPVDLFFVEFAVNDDQDAGHAKREATRGMEGIIRQCLKHNPNMDIVITYFVNPGMLKLLQEEKTPVSIASHAAVAEHYQVSTIHLAREVAMQITSGSFTWAKYGGTHPKPPGNRMCADMIHTLSSQAWSQPLTDKSKVTSHKLPKPIDAGNYSNGRFLPNSAAESQSGWKLFQPNWKTIPGGFRSEFAGKKLQVAEKINSQLVVKFSGRGLGAYVLAGPDAGILEVSIDGGKVQKTDLYHRFSGGLHYPRTVMFATDLEDGDHTATIRVSETHNAKSKGYAARVLHFVAN